MSKFLPQSRRLVQTTQCFCFLFFFPSPRINVELPGWNQASGTALPQRCTICSALLISLMTGTFQGARLVIYRINKQTQAINTFSLLGLNRPEHSRHRSGQRTSTGVSFGEMMRRWKSLSLGGGNSLSHGLCVVCISSGVNQAESQ